MENFQARFKIRPVKAASPKGFKIFFFKRSEQKVEDLRYQTKLSQEYVNVAWIIHNKNFGVVISLKPG